MPDFTVNVRFRSGGGNFRRTNLFIIAPDIETAMKIAPDDGRKRGMDVVEVLGAIELEPEDPDTKDYEVTQREGDAGIIVQWYMKDDWPQIKQLIPSLLPDSYETWYEGAAKAYLDESIGGNVPDVVIIRPGEYELFCNGGGMDTDDNMSLIYFCTRQMVVIKEMDK